MAVQARHAETRNPPMTHAMPSPSSHPRGRLIQRSIQQSYMRLQEQPAENVRLEG